MSKQKLKQKTVQNLSPQQIQFLSLLQIPLIHLEKRIEEELEENPVLEEEEEEEEGSRDLSEPLNYSVNPKSYDLSQVQIEDKNNSLSAHLHEQLIILEISEEKKFIISYLINSLDERGFLNREVYSVCSDLLINHDLEVPEADLINSLETLKKFEPYGVGARDLQECLSIQLKICHPKNKTAQVIMSDYYTSFTNKNFDYIITKLNISKKQLKQVYVLVESLNPNPGGGFSRNVQHEYIEPDFKIIIKDGLPALTLNKPNKRILKINNYYSSLLEETTDRETKKFLKNKIEKAVLFKESLNQRDETLKTVMSAIIRLQEQYFISGNEKDLIPMKLADVAKKVNMDLSTISRVSNSKYIETLFGTFKVKELFSEGYQKENGEIISTNEIKIRLEEIIRNEDKGAPLTDEEIVDLLAESHYCIARRTVTKYREKLNIPKAKLRKQL